MRKAIEYIEKDKEFRKSRKKDKEQLIKESLDRDLDARERWMGIRRLKSDYKPQPFQRNDERGKPVTRSKSQKEQQHI